MNIQEYCYQNVMHAIGLLFVLVFVSSVSYIMHVALGKNKLFYERMLMISLTYSVVLRYCIPSICGIFLPKHIMCLNLHCVLFVMWALMYLYVALDSIKPLLPWLTTL